MTRVELRGYIGSETANARMFEGLPPGELHVLVDSDGGRWAEGLAIYRALRRHPGRVTVEIAGAGSIAPVVAVGADRRLIHADGWMALHATWDCYIGHVEEIRKALAETEAEEQATALLFSERTGAPVERIVRLMRDETVLSAQQALELGLATEIIPVTGQASSPPVCVSHAERQLRRLQVHVENLEPGFMRWIAGLALKQAKRLNPRELDALVARFEWTCPDCGRLSERNPSRGCAHCN